MPFPAHSLWKHINKGGFKTAIDTNHFQRECEGKRAHNQIFFRCLPLKENLLIAHLTSETLRSQMAKSINVPQLLWGFVARFFHIGHMSLQKTHCIADRTEEKSRYIIYTLMCFSSQGLLWMYSLNIKQNARSHAGNSHNQ